MLALKKARKLISDDPTSKEARTFSYLIVSLEMGHEFLLSELYKLSYSHFELALDVIKEWRLDRYHASKVKLYDWAWQLADKEAQAK
jgi:hypothetical protein